MYVCVLLQEKKCLFIGMKSFDLIDITAIVPECDHLIVCFLVVWLGTFIGKDNNLRKSADRKKTRTIRTNCILLAQFHNSMQQWAPNLTSLLRIAFGDVGTPITSIHPLTGAFSGSDKVMVTSMSSVVFALIDVA